MGWIQVMYRLGGLGLILLVGAFATYAVRAGRLALGDDPWWSAWGVTWAAALVGVMVAVLASWSFLWPTQLPLALWMLAFVAACRPAVARRVRLRPSAPRVAHDTPGSGRSLVASIPVALFAYSRPDHLREALGCLRENGVPLVYAFSDGPGSPDKAPAVARVREMLREIDWCEVVLCERDTNLGLGRSILTGVSAVLREHQAAIVVEDDLDLCAGHVPVPVRCVGSL